MPAPSSLLGGQIAQAPNYLAPRAIPTYQSLPPLMDLGTHNYASIPYGHNFHSATGSPFLPAVGSCTWQPSPYHHPSYVQAHSWSHQPQSYKPAKPTTKFGSLPREAWVKVFQYLDYADRLRLQRVNRFWAESLKSLDKRVKEHPSDAEYADMHGLVLQAENYRKHWAPSAAAESKTPAGRPRGNARNSKKEPQASDDMDESSNGKKDFGLVGNIGCYHCFTVRAPGFFAMKIDDEDENPNDDDEGGGSSTSRGVRRNPAPRRYCLDCGIKKGFHPPGKYLETKAGNNHIIWICCEGYYEYGLRNCPKCGRGCPLTPVNKSSRNSRKRSSPMPPPPSPSPRRQRTLEMDKSQSAGYDQPYPHSQWP